MLGVAEADFQRDALGVCLGLVVSLSGFLHHLKKELTGTQMGESLSKRMGETVDSHGKPEWFALMVKPRFEKSVSTLLRQKGYEEFLPLTPESRNWSDRIKTVDLPLFPRYLFCRFQSQKLGPVLNTPGVQRIVGFGSRPESVPDREIAALRTLIESGFPRAACEYLAEGQAVLVREGPLAGVEGMLVKDKGSCRVVVSIHLLQRSVYAEVDRAALVAVS